MKYKIKLFSILLAFFFCGNPLFAQENNKSSEESTILKKSNPDVKADSTIINSTATWKKTKNPNYNNQVNKESNTEFTTDKNVFIRKKKQK